MYKVKAYKSAVEDHYVGLVEWQVTPGIPSKISDVKFGFTSYEEAQEWAGQRLKELEDIR